MRVRKGVYSGLWGGFFVARIPDPTAEGLLWFQGEEVRAGCERA